MNTVLIVFLVVVIIIAIFLMIQFYNPGYLIQSPKPLNIRNPKTTTYTQSIIDVGSIENPESPRYFYEGWFFITTNDQINSETVLFNRGNNFVVTLNGSTLSIYTNTSLSTGVNQSTGVLDTSGLTPIITVPSIPFQKWCQLVINVDGTTIDFYIDGKFVQTVNASTPIATNTTDNISYGNQYTIGYVTKFRRPATVINPQGVWNSYMMGSGQTSITNYHLNAKLTKNKTDYINQRLV